jgi:hypothetical protein
MVTLTGSGDRFKDLVPGYRIMVEICSRDACVASFVELRSTATQASQL